LLWVVGRGFPQTVDSDDVFLKLICFAGDGFVSEIIEKTPQAL
jgi:hypothetical protein